MQEEIYEPDSVKILSRHKNLIGFKFEVAHLRGALRAASNSEAESTEIKLAIKSKAYGAEVQGTPQKPFLCLTSKGMSSNMTHEIPIGLPLTAPGGVHVSIPYAALLALQDAEAILKYNCTALAFDLTDRSCDFEVHVMVAAYKEFTRCLALLRKACECSTLQNWMNCGSKGSVRNSVPTI